jgi:hypothetical protein
MANLLPKLIALYTLPNLMPPSTVGIKIYVPTLKRFSEITIKYSVKERFKINYINIHSFKHNFCSPLVYFLSKSNLIFWKKWR